MDPKQSFLASSYCSEIPGLANYEMPNEVCEGNFGGTFFRHHDSRSARNGCHRAAGLGKSRQVGWQPAILKSRLLAAEFRHLGLGTRRPAILKSRLLAAGLRYLGLGTLADTQQSWNTGYWQLGLGT